MALTLGYKASGEQFGPGELLDCALRAEAAGLEIIAVSDHFQPWRHHGGHSAAAIP
jgi:coenzyme F420-dependent glucose-6-phosphate dehydrogenase